jgi:hypothetical protein
MKQHVFDILKTIKADSNLYDIAEKIDSIYNKPFEGELLEAWEAFLEMRTKMKKPATPRAQKMLKKSLMNLSLGDIQRAIDIVDRSNVNNWLDFYPLQEERKASIINNNHKQLMEFLNR